LSPPISSAISTPLSQTSHWHMLPPAISAQSTLGTTTRWGTPIH